jgi:hypothetical protein
MLQRVILLLVCTAVVACNTSDSSPKGVVYDSLAPYRDSIEAANNVTDTVRISEINAYNKECSLIEDSMQFRWPIHLAKNDLGFVRVRSDASCFDADSCFHNLIGTIPDNQWLWSYGTVKYKYWSAGLAWVICVRDSKGRLVKGYISETVVDHD